MYRQQNINIKNMHVMTIVRWVGVIGWAIVRLG
jgi:hypothetical protein